MGDWYMVGFILFIGILVGMTITTAVIKNDSCDSKEGRANEVNKEAVIKIKEGMNILEVANAVATAKWNDGTPLFKTDKGIHTLGEVLTAATPASLYPEEGEEK